MLRQALEKLPPETHPELLIGASAADDAGVYRLDERTGLIQTVDFFTPVVDDPYDFGRIAAANALSDVYAMGGRPLTALNILCFPSGDLPPEVMTAILAGGGDKVREAGAVVAGGHTVDDKELKYGIAVTGIVDPRKVLKKKGARPGDALVLSKPVGTGLLTTALKQGRLDDELLEEITESMAALSAPVAEEFLHYTVHAVTDVTGNGLLGHAFEMAEAGAVTFILDPGRIPLFTGLPALAVGEFAPGGTARNREYVGDALARNIAVDESMERILFDPQTSGGLLVAVPENEAGEFAGRIADRGFSKSAIIGRVEERGDHLLLLDSI